MTWCDTIDDRAAELALGIVDEPEQTELMSHVEGCDRCRRLIEDLSEAADRVVLAAPEVEPPIGFESRAISVMGGESAPSIPRRRTLTTDRNGATGGLFHVGADSAPPRSPSPPRWLRSSVRSRSSGRPRPRLRPQRRRRRRPRRRQPRRPGATTSGSPRRAPCGPTDGADVGGAVVINSPEPVLVMWLDGARAGAPYGCTVVFRDGTSSDVGTWTPRESDTTWSVPLDARSTDAVALVVTGSYGREIARADLE